MAVQQKKVSKKAKEANLKALKRVKRQLKRVRTSKDVGEEVAKPVIRTMTSWGKTAEKTREQVGKNTHTNMFQSMLFNR